VAIRAPNRQAGGPASEPTFSQAIACLTKNDVIAERDRPRWKRRDSSAISRLIPSSKSSCPQVQRSER